MPVSEHSIPASTLLVGCGQLGTRLGQHLVTKGSTVYALRRNTTELPKSFNPLPVDLLNPQGASLPATDAMVITLTPNMPETAGQPGYLLALKHLADLLPAVPARVVFVSSTRVFEGCDDDVTLTESHPPQPVSNRGRLLLAGEQTATELFDAQLLRPAGIYGPGREFLIRKVLQQSPINPAQRTNRIHEADLARGIYHLLTAQHPPAVVHAVDKTPGVPLEQVVTHIAKRLNLPAPPTITPAVSSGRVLSGQRFENLVGQYCYPTFVQGYDQIITQ